MRPEAAVKIKPVRIQKVLEFVIPLKRWQTPKKCIHEYNILWIMCKRYQSLLNIQCTTVFLLLFDVCICFVPVNYWPIVFSVF